MDKKSESNEFQYSSNFEDDFETADFKKSNKSKGLNLKDSNFYSRISSKPYDNQDDKNKKSLDIEKLINEDKKTFTLPIDDFNDFNTIFNKNDNLLKSNSSKNHVFKMDTNTKTSLTKPIDRKKSIKGIKTNRMS